MAQGPAQASGPSGPKTQGGACTGQTLDYATGPRAHCRQLWRRGAIQTDVLRNLQRTEGPGLRAQSGANVRRVRTLRCHRVLTGLKSALDLAGPWAQSPGPRALQPPDPPKHQFESHPWQRGAIQRGAIQTEGEAPPVNADFSAAGELTSGLVSEAILARTTRIRLAKRVAMPPNGQKNARPQAGHPCLAAPRNRRCRGVALNAYFAPKRRRNLSIRPPVSETLC